MADDAGRLSGVLAETSFLYGGNAEFVEDLYTRWTQDPSSVEPSWRAFFASLADNTDAIRRAGEPPTWTLEPLPESRPEWLAAIDGLWPAMDAKLATRIVERAPSARPDEVRARTLDSLRA